MFWEGERPREPRSGVSAELVITHIFFTVALAALMFNVLLACILGRGVWPVPHPAVYEYAYSAARRTMGPGGVWFC